MIWKPVKGYEGLYEVSNTGLVKRLARFAKRKNTSYKQPVTTLIMAQKSDKDGYKNLALRKNGTRLFKRTSRLVCEAFHENTYSKPLVNHKNGIKDDNRSENLEWVTLSENELHSFRVLFKTQKTRKRVAMYDKLGNLLKVFTSLTAAERCGFIRSDITKAIKGEYKYHKGFTWKRFPSLKLAS